MILMQKPRKNKQTEKSAGKRTTQIIPIHLFSIADESAVRLY